MNTTNINELVGARIRLARKARGLSVKELANRCGVHANTLEHYERWQKRALQDPHWAEQNPMKVMVYFASKPPRMHAVFLPDLF